MSLDPQFEPVLRAAADQSRMVNGSPEDARVRVRAGDVLTAPGPAVREVHDLTVPAAAGPLGARRYVPDGVPVGTVVYLHGGGWVTGDLAYSDAFCRHLAADGGCQVLSVDYRLAPEHPFPAAMHDAWAALTWAADELAGGGPLVVGGDSAGGALAAGCALRARDEGAPGLAAQLLVYPVLDADLTRPSYRDNASVLIGPEEMEWFWDHYLPDRDARLTPAASPLRAKELAGLSPALLVVADLDPLRDEGLAYAERLSQAGVRVELRHVHGLIHGFLRFTARVDSARGWAPEIARDLRRLLSER